MSNFWKKKKVLITGANGFLGSHLSVFLLQKGAIITGIIKETPEKTYLTLSVSKKNRNLRLILSDISDFNRLHRIYTKTKPDVCLHIAAQPIVGIANKSPLPTFKTNIKGTWNVLETARVNTTKAVIVASSDKAYGDHTTLPYREDAALQALHPYDVSKACADMLARCYAHTYSMPVAVTRCANIFGPGDFYFSRIIPDTIRAALSRQHPVIRSDGSPLRDYIYIEDIVNAYTMLAEKLYNNQLSPGEAFNFGTGRPIAVLPLVKKILRIMNSESLEPHILSKRKIKGEIDKQYLTSKKAGRMLGWKCRYSLEQGLKKTIAWYTQNL